MLVKDYTNVVYFFLVNLDIIQSVSTGWDQHLVFMSGSGSGPDPTGSGSATLSQFQPCVLQDSKGAERVY